MSRPKDEQKRISIFDATLVLVLRTGFTGLRMADVAAILDPECFVIGGGVSEAGDILLGSTVRAFGESVTGRDHRTLPKIVVAQLGNAAGLAGAADLARYR